MKRWKKGVLIGLFSSLLFDQQAVEAAVSISKTDALAGAAPVTPQITTAYSVGKNLEDGSATKNRKVPTQLGLVADMNDLNNANEVTHAPPRADLMQTAFYPSNEASSEHLLLAEQKEIAANPVLAALLNEPVLASRGDLPPAMNQRVVQSQEAAQIQTDAAASTATATDKVEVQDAQGLTVQTQVAPSQTQTAQTQAQQQPTRTQAKAQTSVTSNSGPTMLAGSGATSTRGGRLVAIAKQYLGDPYCYGGTTPSGFDCSGFTQFVFRQAGLDLPRTTYSQVNAGTPVSKQNLQPGDIVFFSCGGQATSHCGLYIGNGQFIHADLTRGIAIAELNSPYWSGVYQTAVRVQ